DVIECDDDGVDCTVERCLEPTGACESVPRAARCEAGEMCDATLGCVQQCGDGSGLCDPLERCGCPAGDACYHDPVTLEPSCSVEGAGRHGEACDIFLSSQCAAGHQCVIRGGGVPGV